MSSTSSDRGNTGRAPAAVDDLHLLRAATLFGNEPGFAEIVRILSDAVTPLSERVMLGLGLYDPRRKVVVLSSAPQQPGGDDAAPGLLAPEGEEFPLEDMAGGTCLSELRAYSSGELSPDTTVPIERRFHELGVRRYLAIPLSSQAQLVGVLYVGFVGTGEIAPDTSEYMQRLARILTPAFVNCRTRTRLAKGDRRRATLAELSHAINTSLRLDSVLSSAREAIGRIDGHEVSIIGLFDEGQANFRAYWQPADKQPGGAKTGDPEVLPVSSTAFAWVKEHHETYESDDLEREAALSLDERLRQAGVRRYAVAPMFVRGRIIGGFLFGTSDPHPALTTDVWLYENIALQLGLAIDNAIQYGELKRLSDRLAEQNVYLREEIETAHNVEGMIGRSPAIRGVLEQISRVAGTGASVLIVGETGVGKELVARAVHAGSDRADHPLVKVNCAAIPENLVESELFGHERGAFTSATSRRIGRFELAQGGTLFLDEVGELPLAVQAKLLRVLQDGEFERLGGTRTIRTDARIIAATNRDLREAIEKGAFRSDLYYRLSAFPLPVPPLSERREDIPLLAEAFMAQLSRKMGKDIRTIDAESVEYLRAQDWPGNIRELRHVVERAMILSDGPELVIDRAAAAPVQPGPRQAGRQDEHAGSPAVPVPGTYLGTLQETERAHILSALERTRWTIEGPRGAAVILGLRPSTLRSRMKRLGIART